MHSVLCGIFVLWLLSNASVGLGHFGIIRATSQALSIESRALSICDDLRASGCLMTLASRFCAIAHVSLGAPD